MCRSNQRLHKTELKHRLKLNDRYAVDRHTLTFGELMESAWADNQRRLEERLMREEQNASATVA